MTLTHVPWRRPMTGRDPEETDRTATPLELIFDLCFVVAVAGTGLTLHDDVARGGFGGVVAYLMVFFAIWWAWLSYSWFASAYDPGDVIFRLVTFWVMAGVLLLTSAIPRATGAGHDVRLITVAYVSMRLAMVPLWLRVAREDTERRLTAQWYAGGAVVVQAGWLVWGLTLPAGWARGVGFVLLASAELALAPLAQRRGGDLPWHPEHVAERHQLFSIIVLGEVILATTQALSGAVEKNGVSLDLGLVALASLLLVLGMWWLYFKRSMAESLRQQASLAFRIAHFFVFASIAGVGAALSVIVEQVEHHDSVSPRTSVLLLAGAVAVYLVGLAGVHALADDGWRIMGNAAGVGALAVVVGLAGTLVTDRIGVPVLLVALVVTGAVVHHQLVGRGGGVVFPEEREGR